jgi:hypothetical protein
MCCFFVSAMQLKGFLVNTGKGSRSAPDKFRVTYNEAIQFFSDCVLMRVIHADEMDILFRNPHCETICK